MTKKYSTDELATIIQQLIYAKFDSPNKIKIEFNSNLKRKVKSLHSEILTDEEIEINSTKISTSIYNDLNRITKDFIIKKLSREVKNRINSQEIDLLDYKVYFNDLAVELVKELIQAKYNSVKQEIRKYKSKK